ncbi:hypothetical protein PHYSODRAFT_294358 [Phytophthora sojae]|uniref:Uncharacterized protein n=1 Tax=Phytophthora sojae (strain P6497) TaxID=1094619 RepID=G4YE01_PHYSP|nr:hypothetical protein PHYSODRAFT_294358 [Phytophthora sojae]EGZ29019.1 hypothetical protein PHYSODRAFT_294358 [Phytophthora sojae]|eukprot:XP_009516294.1 hypothetical protein PHYSODRAFT_294358 [Phytophthora sojae]
MNIKYILLDVEGLVHTTIWNGHETVGMLKANLTSTNGTLFGNIDPMKLMIFRATKANGAFIPIESRRVRKMLSGKIPSLVAEVLSKENELKDVHFVNDVIPGTAAPSGVVHVLEAFGEMEIVCSLKGREGPPIELQVNIRDTNLHRVVGDALGTTKPDWKLFLSRERDGAWINTDSDDARALMRGQDH